MTDTQTGRREREAWWGGSWFQRAGRSLSVVLMLLAPAALASCASSQPTAPPGPIQHSAKPAENLSDVEDNLRQFKNDVRAFVASAADPSSREDPNSFRGRERAGEQRLSQRAAELRRRIHAAFGTTPAPAPGAPRAGGETTAADPKREQQLLQDLDESEKQLGQAPR